VFAFRCHCFGTSVNFRTNSVARDAALRIVVAECRVDIIVCCYLGAGQSSRRVSSSASIRTLGVDAAALVSFSPGTVP
jgi:hypothetical protein